MTTNTPFEEGLDEILDSVFVFGVGTNADDIKGNETAYSNLKKYAINEAKSALTQLHKAAIVAELEAIRNIKGVTLDAWASPAYQMLLDRIAQLKNEEKRNDNKTPSYLRPVS